MRRAPCGCQSRTEDGTVVIWPCRAGCPSARVVILAALALRRPVRVQARLRAVR